MYYSADNKTNSLSFVSCFTIAIQQGSRQTRTPHTTKLPPVSRVSINVQKISNGEPVYTNRGRGLFILRVSFIFSQRSNKPFVSETVDQCYGNPRLNLNEQSFRMCKYTHSDKNCLQKKSDLEGLKNPMCNLPFLFST